MELKAEVDRQNAIMVVKLANAKWPDELAGYVTRMMGTGEGVKDTPARRLLASEHVPISPGISEVMDAIRGVETKLDAVLDEMFGSVDILGNRSGDGCRATCKEVRMLLDSTKNVGIQGISKLACVIGGVLLAAFGGTWLWLWHALQEVAAEAK